MDLTQQIHQFFLKWNFDTQKSQFLLACSGGADSMALLHIMHQLNVNFAVAHCNFQLRDEDSNADENLVVKTCNDLNIRYFVKQYTHLAEIKNSGKSIQEQARKLRYQFLNDLCNEFHFDYIVTAHHANDQIENFLMYATRGTGIKGLVGMQEVSGNLIRPLLHLLKTDLLDFISIHHIHFREDKSNLSNDYTRNKVRNEILPLFSNLYPNYIHNLKKTIHNLQSFYEASNFFLQQTIEANVEVKDKIHFIKTVFIKILPFNVFYHLMENYQLNEDQVKVIYQFVVSNKSGLKLTLNDRIFYVQRKYLIITPIQESILPTTLIDNFETDFQIRHLSGVLLKQGSDKFLDSSNTIYCNADKLVFPLTWRVWKQGDKMKPKGLKGSKKISDILIDNKIEIFDKERTYVLVNGDGEIIWLAGIRISETFVAKENIRNVLKLIFSGNN